MDRCRCSLLAGLLFITAAAGIGHILTLDVQLDERVRLECTVSSKIDADEAMWMRIRPPHNPDILTYRDAVVYAPDRIELEQRRLSSSTDLNGTLIDTYALTLTILRPQINDEGRYLCSRGREVFAEYDLFVIVPPQFADDHRFTQQRTLVEGSTLNLTCSAHGRPQPSITWFYRYKDERHVRLSDAKGCQAPLCELHLENYTRHDPTIIECVADNGKSIRVSKIFHLDVLYAPTVTTAVRTLAGLRKIDVFLECSSEGNPPPSIVWLDENHLEIPPSSSHTFSTTNQSSVLSFAVLPYANPKVLYSCRSQNSVGTDERRIDITEFLYLGSKLSYRTGVAMEIRDPSSLNRARTTKPSRRRSKTAPPRTSTVPASTSSNLSMSKSIVVVFMMCHLFHSTMS